MGWYAFDGLYIHYRNNFWVNYIYVRNETKFVVVVKKIMSHKQSVPQ